MRRGQFAAREGQAGAVNTFSICFDCVLGKADALAYLIRFTFLEVLEMPERWGALTLPLVAGESHMTGSAGFTSPRLRGEVRAAMLCVSINSYAIALPTRGGKNLPHQDVRIRWTRT
jgi:hypothetical protein